MSYDPTSLEGVPEHGRERLAEMRRGLFTSSFAQELHLVAAWIADHRCRSLQPCAPWPDAPLATADRWRFAEVLHLASPPEPACSARIEPPADVLGQAEALGLIVGDSDGYRPGAWQLTAVHDVFAVRDRAPDGHPRVYLGDDGTRLLDTVVAARPRGTVVDVGCGAGLATAAAALSADEVLGFDVVPACVDAARLSARLNGVAHKVSITNDDLIAFQPDRRIECVIANLPGVPVPAGLAYPAAGYGGGEDGLRLARHLLDRLPAWTAHGRTARPDAPVLLMRLQSPGDPDGPFALQELQALAGAARLDVSVVTDSRIDVAVRDSLTIKGAAHHNPEIDRDVIEESVRSHSSQLGMTHYYSSSVVARLGTGQLRHIDLAIRDCLNTPLRIEPPNSPGATQQIVGRYFARLARLPMGFWELADSTHVEGPPARIDELVALINEGCTAAQSVREVFAHEFAADPTAALALFSTTGLLIETIRETADDAARTVSRRG